MKTLVIGAGIAGLITARELSRAGRTVVLVEPRARVGGRIMTRRSKRYGFPVDLGPEFVHGNPPETRAIVPDATHEIIKLNERERVFWRGELSPADGDRLEKVMAAMSERVPDQPIIKAIDEMGLDPLTHGLVLSFIEGFNAADAWHLSTNAILEETRGAQDDLLDNYRLLTGYHVVTERLAEAVRADGGEIRLNETVHDVRWTPGRAVVRIARETGEYEETFDHVVNTAPISCFGDIAYEPALPTHAKAASLIAMGPVHKVTITFTEKLWERPPKVDIDFLHAPEFTFSTRWAWGWVDPFTVTCWSAGRRAAALNDLGEAAVIDRALEDLAGTLGLTTETLRAMTDEVFYHDWVNDPHARGAYSYPLVGGERARAELGQSVAGTLFFAGEATDVTGAAGTVHGAIRSGLRVAAELLDDRSNSK